MTKILIAEDDKFLGKAYQVKLAKADFEVKIANDGEETLQILETFTPDVILLDLIMPRKDGFTTLKELRANPKYAQIPVLVASNLGQSEDIGRAMELGATDYVVKSDMNLAEIIKKINDLVK